MAPILDEVSLLEMLLAVNWLWVLIGKAAPFLNDLAVSLSKTWPVLCVHLSCIKQLKEKAQEKG